MTNKALTTIRQAQPVFSPSLSDILPVEYADGSGECVATLSDVNKLLNGQTKIVQPSEGFKGASLNLQRANEHPTDASVSYFAYGIITCIPLQWGKVITDTANCWSGVAAKRLNVPRGATKVQLTACLAISGGAFDYLFSITKNGEYTKGVVSSRCSGLSTLLVSPVLSVQEGDYFEVTVDNINNRALAIFTNTGNHFSMRVLEQIDI